MTAIAILAVLVLLAVCATLGRGVVALAARWVLVIVAALLLVALLAGCAPPPPPTATVLDLQDATVPPWLWSGADHPEWPTCRYEPPSALCVEEP